MAKETKVPKARGMRVMNCPENEGRGKSVQAPHEVESIRIADQIIGEYAVAFRRIRMIEQSTTLFARSTPTRVQETDHEHPAPPHRRRRPGMHV
jgi:hypothetical protein